MLRPTRPLPRVGARARIEHFGGGNEAGTVAAVRDGGRRLLVASEAGELVEFVLNRATAKFVAAGGAGGSRLDLLEA